MSDEHRSWVEITAAGFRALNSLGFAETARRWLEASAVVENAPWRAAAQTNRGAAYALLGESQRAIDALAEAELAWQAHAGAVESAEADLAGRSSAFHFRLAARNLDAFQMQHRRQLARFCEAGKSIAHFNRLVVSERGLPGADVIATLVRLLGETLGANAPETRALSALSNPDRCDFTADIYAHKAASYSISPAAASSAVSDLKTALGLTALLTPELLRQASSAVVASNTQSIFSLNMKHSSS